MSGRGSARQRARVVTAFMQVILPPLLREVDLNCSFSMSSLRKDAICALRSRWRGMQGVRRAEHRIPFDLCN
jgi:hypothetical protein